MISTTNDHIVDPPFRIDRGMTQENFDRGVDQSWEQTPTYALGKYHTKLPRTRQRYQATTTNRLLKSHALQ